jgi:hypothetical protein
MKRFALLLCLCACQKPSDPAPVKPAPPAAPVIDTRDQYAFASALSQAQRSPPEEQEQRYAELRRDYRDKRLSWEVRFSPTLCRSGDRCVVLPFDHARSKERIVQGWLPRLELNAAGFEELERACAPHAACVFRFEGTLEKLIASPELPTSLSFSDVRVVRARAETSSESWGRKQEGVLKTGARTPRTRP